MVKFKADDPLFGQIAEQLARPDLADGILSYFHFAAGKIHDDVKDYRKAFHHFREGNRLTHRQFDAQAFRALVKNLIYHYSPGHLRSHQGVGLDTEMPVFIIGMPRSGTTLVEQILASHTAVFGAGELNDMKRLAASESTLAGQAAVSGFVPGYSTECLQARLARKISRHGNLTHQWVRYSSHH